MTFNEPTQLQAKIKQAFADVPRPNLEDIDVLGCCAEHEPDYQVYRQQTWREFNLAHDSADFVTIHPLAFHYFTPGVLIAVIESLFLKTEPYWRHDEYWLLNFIISPDRIADFKRDYLPHFDLPQRQAIAETLVWYKQWFQDEHGWDCDERDENDSDGRSITDSINLVWRSQS